MLTVSFKAYFDGKYRKKMSHTSDCATPTRTQNKPHLL